MTQRRRFKVLWGGRGGGRTWGIAMALLMLGTQRPIRVLCVREIQKSIDESVHAALKAMVIKLGLEHFYEIQRDKIIGRFPINPGEKIQRTSEFFFEGIRNNTTKIKSYEGIDYCWVEEATKVSQSSWMVLIPTIRKEHCPNDHALGEEFNGSKCPVCHAEVIQSEIWMSFNPELEDDYTYQRFVVKPNPKDTLVIKTNWRDNPYFPAVMRKDLEDLKDRDYEEYLNVYEGHTKQILSGAVFAKELQRAKIENRICTVPYDPEVPVDTFWDLGRRDMMCIWFAQRVSMQWRMLEYYENSMEEIGFYVRHLKSRPYMYGAHYLPHDAKRIVLGQKRSVEQIMRKMTGVPVVVVKRIPRKVNAINAARMIFPNCWFDAELCADGLTRLRRYKYEVNSETGVRSEEPLHDENSHGADGYMTFAQHVKVPEERGTVSKFISELTRKSNKFTSSAPGQGWMG